MLIRCLYHLTLNAYVELGASQWIIDMHAAFLCGRFMQFKVGNILSTKLPVTGGAVQGSVLGVMDHNAVMEIVDEDFLTKSLKYVDNLTSTAIIDHDAGCYTISGSLTGERDVDLYHAEKSEENINRITHYCRTHGLKVNEKKTQLLAISSNRNRTKGLLPSVRHRGS